jgi:type IV pilus assembly protein PilM
MSIFGPDMTGIDIGTSAVKIVRVTGARRQTVVSAQILELPLAEGTGGGKEDALRIFKTGGKIGKRVATLLPGKHLTIRHLTFPKMPPAELHEAVQWESKRHIPYGLDAAVIEYLVLGERQEGSVDKNDVLLVAADQNAVNEFLVPFERAKVDVDVLDAHPLALRNVLRIRTVSSDDNVLLIDIGAGKTEIDIFRQGGLRFSRCVETGGLDVTRAVAADLGVGLEDAEAIKVRTNVLSAPDDDRAAASVRTKLDTILLEIRRSVEYFKTTFREKGVARTLLTGGVALTPGIQEYFSRSLDGPVEIDDPFSGVAVDTGVLDELHGQSSRFAAAVGLALRSA